MLSLAAAAALLLTKGEPVEPQSVVVVDGDTIRADGVKVRIANIDAPESGPRARCDAERFLAVNAARKAESLAAARPFVIWPEGRADKYGRPLVRVTVAGEDWGRIMIGEYLAAEWEGKRHDWCAAAH